MRGDAKRIHSSLRNILIALVKEVDACNSAHCAGHPRRSWITLVRAIYLNIYSRLSSYHCTLKSVVTPIPLHFQSQCTYSQRLHLTAHSLTPQIIRLVLHRLSPTKARLPL